MTGPRSSSAAALDVTSNIVPQGTAVFWASAVALAGDGASEAGAGQSGIVASAAGSVAEEAGDRCSSLSAKGATPPSAGCPARAALDVGVPRAGGKVAVGDGDGEGGTGEAVIAAEAAGRERGSDMGKGGSPRKPAVFRAETARSMTGNDVRLAVLSKTESVEARRNTAPEGRGGEPARASASPGRTGRGRRRAGSEDLVDQRLARDGARREVGADAAAELAGLLHQGARAAGHRVLDLARQFRHL